MSTEQVRTIMLIFGGLFLFVGIAARIGFWKDWFWRGQRMVYGYIPLGLLFTYWSFKPVILPKIGSNLFAYQIPTVIVLIISLWFSKKPPEFVKPTWIRWIELHPKRVVEAMTEAVKSGEDWTDRVKSKQAVDAWARKLKNKLPRRKAK